MEKTLHKCWITFLYLCMFRNNITRYLNDKISRALCFTFSHCLLDIIRWKVTMGRYINMYFTLIISIIIIHTIIWSLIFFFNYLSFSWTYLWFSIWYQNNNYPGKLLFKIFFRNFLLKFNWFILNFLFSIEFWRFSIKILVGSN